MRTYPYGELAGLKISQMRLYFLPQNKLLGLPDNYCVFMAAIEWHYAYSDMIKKILSMRLQPTQKAGRMKRDVTHKVRIKWMLLIG